MDPAHDTAGPDLWPVIDIDMTRAGARDLARALLAEADRADASEEDDLIDIESSPEGEPTASDRHG